MTDQSTLPPLPEHPESQVMRWSNLEVDAIRRWGREVFEAGRRAALSAPAQVAAQVAQDEQDGVREELLASIVACLGDDAAKLREMHADDGLVDQFLEEIADNMEAAADLIEELIESSTAPKEGE